MLKKIVTVSCLMVSSASYTNFDLLDLGWAKLYNDMKSSFSQYTSPSMHIRDIGNRVLVTVEVPGFEKKDIGIEFINNNRAILIKGARETEEERETAESISTYDESYKFSIVGALPSEVNPESAEASLRNGILKIKLDKVLDKKSSIKIEIKD